MHIATAEAMLSHMGPKVQQELMAQVDAKTGVWKSNPYTIASYRAFAEKLGQDYVLSFHDSMRGLCSLAPPAAAAVSLQTQISPPPRSAPPCPRWHLRACRPSTGERQGLGLIAIL